ncbi:pentatricopeptide repeat-containing protein At5g66520-like [Aristolochia californica]|uniref:pentatricopeptide repeat-containing protein At5g66520-like n=1 Tax=Aristolochia californica TaxID=171875 RepID=UPI0035DFF469
MGLQQEELYLRKLITFFAISHPPSINYALLIFDRIEHPSTFICNTMIRGYATSKDPVIAVNLYNQMVKQSIPADKYTYTFLLKACSNLPSLPKGEETHCRVVKHGFNYDVFVQNSLVHLYGCNSKIGIAWRVFDGMPERDVGSWTTLVSCCARFGSIEEARGLFDDMPQRSVVSFSCMIAGYVHRGKYKEALCLFRDLQLANLEPNNAILTSVLCACSNLGALESGKWIHSYIQQKGKKLDSRVTTALIDMYCKCGSVENAVTIFASAKEKHIGEWTAMISGLGMQGYGEKSIILFEEMIKSGIKPNVVSFVALLSACTHAGLVEDGLKYFERMESEFGIKPTIEHYGCVIDLLGRGGLIEEAMEVVRRMPMEANAAIWGAIFNACRVYKIVQVGELAAQKLINQEPRNGAVYMALMSLYAEVGRGSDVERVKKDMHEAACRRNPGCSLIEVNGSCHEFVAYDNSHPGVLKVSEILGKQVVMEEKGNKWCLN